MYLLLAASIYVVSILALFFLFTQSDRYLIWWSVLLSGPIFMSCLLVFSLLITWIGEWGDEAHSSALRRYCHWYYRSCELLHLEYFIGYMCAWLSHLHFVTGCVAGIVSFIAYLADVRGPFLNIAGLMLIYVSIIVIFSTLRRNCAPQSGLDY